MTTPWLRLDANVLDDARVVRAMSAHGGVAGAVWVLVLTEAKKQNGAGRLQLPSIVVARALFMTDAEAEAVLATFVESGLLLAGEGTDDYEVPRWVEKQPDERSYVAQRARKSLHPGRKPGRPKKRTEMHGNAREMHGNRMDHGPQTNDHGPTTGDNGPRTIDVSSSAVADADSIAECEHLADLIERNGSKRPTVTKAWLQAADRLKRIDGRTHAQVMTCIEWCQADEFWRSNILSMPKLRAKYDQLRLAAGRRASKPSGSDVRAAIARGEIT
jgi:hypothetical protein